MAEFTGPFNPLGSDGVVTGSGLDIEELGRQQNAEYRASHGDDGSAPPAKRRGRQPGSKNAPKETGAGSGASEQPKAATKTVSANVTGIESLLFSIHTMLSAALGMPELALSHDEANKIGKALANVQRHYDFQASEKAVDWANLAIVCASVYGPRVAVAYMRSQKGGASGKPTDQNVVKFSAWPSPSS